MAKTTMKSLFARKRGTKLYRKRNKQVSGEPPARQLPQQNETKNIPEKDADEAVVALAVQQQKRLSDRRKKHDRKRLLLLKQKLIELSNAVDDDEEDPRMEQQQKNSIKAEESEGNCAGSHCGWFCATCF